MSRLADFVHIRRRYMRSVNLERDADLASSLDGYVITPRAIETLENVAKAYREPGSTRAWTITGVYGTGKSAFANLLLASFAAEDQEVRKKATAILQAEPMARDVGAAISADVPTEGLVRAVAVARREPLAHTLVRALSRGAESFWSSRPGPKPSAVHRILELREELQETGSVDGESIPELAIELAEASRTGLVIVIDELGKSLEHASRSSGAVDLFLLQQLAELPAGPDQAPVLLLGLLHQAFSEYGHALASTERAEWEKIQGRFIDVPFAESGDQMLRLIGEAVETTPPPAFERAITEAATSWHKRFENRLSESYVADLMTPDRIADVFPLHPVAALVLPSLCTRFGQNDRSLFTFLASTGPNGFSGFLGQAEADSEQLEVVRLTDVYDYFLDAAALGGTNRLQVNRWAEIHSVIRGSRGLDAEEIEALKTVAVLNLVATAGPLRASRELVVSSLLCTPDPSEPARWSGVVDGLVEKKVLTYRKQVDELRIWQGSDFDVEEAIREFVGSDRRPLSEILTELAPLPPVIAQRHSYRTGTLRYFERQYEDDVDKLKRTQSELEGSDGVVLYWLSEEPLKSAPATTTDEKPLVVVELPPTRELASSAREFAALLTIDKTETALQTDGVARKETRQRIALAREILEQSLRHALNSQGRLWLGGTRASSGRFNVLLSEFCSEVYDKSPVLWNELINRRELTSQGTRAQRELIAAILESHGTERLGIEGSGPEFSMYDSLLRAPGIHRKTADGWMVGPPEGKGIQPLWTAIEEFLFSSTDEPRAVSELYELLEAPPFGVKRGIIPVFLAAALVYHDDDVSVYQDGSFLPILKPPHFELLVKDPARFAVKHFALTGIRQELFRELESVLRAGGAQRPEGARNATLLTVVRPLVRFAAQLPAVTRNAEDLSPEATGVRNALLAVREPDRLVFETLPEALGFEAIANDERDRGRHKHVRKALFDALRELQEHHERVLERARDQIRAAFGMPSPPERFREDLRVRASYLTGKVLEPRLRSFVVAAADEKPDEREWLRSLVMIVADKPAANWTQDDILAFEMNVAELARRFVNLEALQKQSARDGLEGYESRLVTITEPTGHHEHRLFWVDRQEKAVVEEHAARLLDELRDKISSEHQRHAVMITLVEKMLAPSTATDFEQQDSSEEERKHG